MRKYDFFHISSHGSMFRLFFFVCIVTPQIPAGWRLDHPNQVNRPWHHWPVSNFFLGQQNPVSMAHKKKIMVVWVVAF